MKTMKSHKLPQKRHILANTQAKIETYLCVLTFFIDCSSILLKNKTIYYISSNIIKSNKLNKQANKKSRLDKKV